MSTKYLSTDLVLLQKVNQSPIDHSKFPIFFRTKRCNAINRSMANKKINYGRERERNVMKHFKYAMICGDVVLCCVYVGFSFVNEVI